MSDKHAGFNEIGFEKVRSPNVLFASMVLSLILISEYAAFG